MAEIIPFSERLQLVMSFLPQYADGGFSQDAFRFGPFFGKNRLAKWQLEFTDSFQKIFEEESEIVECTIPQAAPEKYDPEEVVLSGMNPLEAAQFVIHQLVNCSERIYEHDVPGPFLWEVIYSLRMAGTALTENLTVVVGPFNEKSDITAWATPFLQTLNSRLASLCELEVDDPIESYLLERSHIFQEEDYLINAFENPQEEAKKLVGFVWQGLMAAGKRK